MIKITKLCKGLLLVGILFAMTNCSNEETAQSDTTQYSETKVWFDNHKNDYNSTVLKYVKDFQWNDAIVTDGNIGKVVEIPFTLEGNLSASSKTANLHNVHHRLMFVKDAVKGYKLLYVQIVTDKAKSKILDNNFNYYNIKNDFDGKVFVQELNTSSASKLEFRNGNKIIPSLTSRMAEEVIECVWLGYWDDGGHFEPIELMYCDSLGDTGEDPTPGYGGGGTTPPTPTPADTPAPPPSCESFNFTSKKGANWQEAAVKNITLKIVVLTQNRVEVTHTMIIPQAVLFGMPINYNKGNGDVTPGAAATVSAMSLNETMKEIAKLYTKTVINELTLRTKFQELVIKNYRLHTNGGTVNFNSGTSLPATNYKTNPTETGLCDI